jgi:hypothetical protein
MNEPTSSRQQDGERHGNHSIDLTKSEGAPSSRANLRIELKPITDKRRFVAWDWLLLFLGALVPLIVTATTSSQIPGKQSSTSFVTILIIAGGLVVVFGAGLLTLALYRRFRAHRLERLESRLSGSDLRAINLFVARELELLSTLGEGGIK